MKPGRHLDALIASKVMGHSYSINSFGFQEEGPLVLKEIPPYSTDIAAAWELVEKLKLAVHPPGCSFANGEYGNSGMTNFNDSKLERSEEPVFWEVETQAGASVYGKTAPHAICLAALKAVEGK